MLLFTLLAASAFFFAQGLISKTLFNFVAFAILVIICHVTFAIWRNNRSKYHTVKTLLLQYLLRNISLFVAKHYTVPRFLRETGNGPQENEKMLLALLKKNRNTIYGKDLKFDEITSVQDYLKKHPLTSYDNYSKYINLIAEEGERKGGILVDDKMVRFAVSSGTSAGSRKLIPLYKSSVRGAWYIAPLMMHAQQRMLGSRSHELRKTADIFFFVEYSYTKSGYKIGPLTGTPTDRAALLQLFTTPWSCYTKVKYIPDALYITALFALRDKEIEAISAVFIITVLDLLKTITNQWQDLLHDLRNGTITGTKQTPSEVLEDIIRETNLQPEPERAEEFEQIMQKYTPNGTLVRQLWPNISYIAGISTGLFSRYGDTVRSKWAADVKFLSTFYGCSEAIIAGLNFETDKGQFCLVPSLIFYEFIPIADIYQEQPSTLLMDHVKVGEQYEMVLTTPSGLYRYRLGDIIKVVGFQGKTPVIEVMYRLGQLLDFHSEKTTELQFNAAIYNAAAKWNQKIVDYCCEPEPVTLEKRGVTKYVAFVEVEDSSFRVSAEHDKILDRELEISNPRYAAMRDGDKLHSAKVILVKSGTFQTILRLSKSGSLNSNQVKLPRVVKNPEYLQILNQNVVPEQESAAQAP